MSRTTKGRNYHRDSYIVRAYPDEWAAIKEFVKLVREDMPAALELLMDELKKKEEKKAKGTDTQ